MIGMGTKKNQPTQREDFIESDLKDPSACMKLRGVREISRSRDVDHFRSLIRIFSEIDCGNRSRSEEREIIREIYKIFVALGTFAFLELTDALSSTDERIRGAAAQIVGYLGFCQTIPALFQVLEDESPKVRKYAVRALCNMRYSRDKIESAVLHALVDSNPEVVQEAIIASGQLELKGAIPYLSEIIDRNLESCDLSDVEHDQIFFATRALGFIGDRAATPVLLGILKELMDDRHIPGLLTYGVIDALGDLRDVGSTKQLVSALWHYQRRCFDSAAQSDDEYGFGGADRDYESFLEAVNRIARALYHLDREADGIIVEEFMDWIKDHRDGKGSECNPLELPRLSVSTMIDLGRMSNNPEESFSRYIVEILRSRGQPVIDPAMGMLESPYQEVRLQGVQILAGFAAGNEKVAEVLQGLYLNVDEDESIKSVAFEALLDAHPAQTLELFRANIAKPRRSEISRPDTYTISRLGHSTFEQVTRVLTNSTSDSVKEKTLDVLIAFINDSTALVPPQPKKNGQRQIRRRRKLYHDRNYCR